MASGPVVGITTANMDFGSGNNGAYVDQLAGWGSVMLLQEAKDFRLADHLPPRWKALQDCGSDAKQGAAIGVNTDVYEVDGWRLEYGCDAVPGEMLARWIIVARLRHRGSGKNLSAISAHVPPPRCSIVVPQFVDNLTKVSREEGKPAIGVDANMPIADLARQVGGVRAFGEGIIGVLTNMRVHNVIFRGWATGHNASDHPGITAQTELVKA